MKTDLIIHARTRDLGGFSVHRSLPSAQRRQLGPFVFLDHMGPFRMDSAHLLDVRPHPHIGLATVTYLFAGRALHRDTLGSKQLIEPGDLNWMTAGRGIAHSERTPPEDLLADDHHEMHGVQIWVGLPVEHEEREPSFIHWPKEKLPICHLSENLHGKVLLGTHQKITSPVEVLSPTLLMDIHCEQGCDEFLSFSQDEIGIFMADGSGKINDQDLQTDDLIIVADPNNVKLELDPESRLIVLGGSPFPEPRHIWWNFVSSKKERIHQAAADWTAQKFGSIAEETDFIPLPKDPLP